MKLLAASVILTLCTWGVHGDLDDIMETFMRRAEKLELGRCKKATDLICPRDEVTFWLYTRSTQSTPTKLNQFNLESLQTAPFVDAPLKFLVHGWSVNKDLHINAVLRPAYFDHGEYNIVSVDWSPLAKKGCYYTSSRNVPTVAHCVAQFFNALVKARNFPSVHFLGHSMGAHISIWASHEIPSLGRLTLFDPALPLFSDKSPLLKKPKAAFVDVYHSNCGVYGRTSPDGDLDVYFNSEEFQPGCHCETTCSHVRCVEYFAESISNSSLMKAFPCGGWQKYLDGKCLMPKEDDLVTVGESVDTTKFGSYLMFTDDSKPFLIEPCMLLEESSYYSFKGRAKNHCLQYDALTLIKDLVGYSD